MKRQALKAEEQKKDFAMTDDMVGASLSNPGCGGADPGTILA